MTSAVDTTEDGYSVSSYLVTFTHEELAECVVHKAMVKDHLADM